MAEIGYIEIDDNNIVVGFHSEDIPAASLIQGYSTQLVEVEEPNSLLGLDAGKIALAPAARQTLGELTLSETQRLELKRLSIELDLQTRMGEDTTVTQAEFDALLNLYNNPV